MKPVVPVAVLILVSVLADACVVSDEIEFSLRRNQPPQFVSADPPVEGVNYAENNTLTEFVVTVWDPDDDDFSRYEGRITLIEQLSSSVQLKDTFSCSEPVRGDASSFDGGVVVTVNCAITMRAVSDDASNLIVMMELSDRGYDAGDETPDGARTLQVMWVYEIFAQNLL